MRADRALKKIERDREKRARWIFWDNQRLVRNSDMDADKESGRKVGVIDGYMAMQRNIARNMIAKGYKSEEIQAITDFSDEEIKELRYSKNEVV
jgi:predicted transposase/invertase (TIGR01784 family)